MYILFVDTVITIANATNLQLVCGCVCVWGGVGVGVGLGVCLFLFLFFFFQQRRSAGAFPGARPEPPTLKTQMRGKK